MCPPVVSRLSLFWLVFGAVLTASALADNGATPTEGDLFAWRDPLKAFEAAGDLLGDGRYKEALACLEEFGKTARSPYKDMAQLYASDLATLLRTEWFTGKGPNSWFELARLSLRLRCYKVAATLYQQITADGRLANHVNPGTVALCLMAGGDLDAAIAEYERCRHSATSDSNRKSFSEMTELGRQRQEKRSEPALVFDYVRKVYLSNRFPVYNDYLGAMKELAGLLDQTMSSVDRLTLYRLMVECLSGLKDEAGARAWEAVVLRESADDAEVCAAVYVGRGKRAYDGTNLDDAIAAFRTVSALYPASKQYGIAQYNVGHILKEQGKHTEAIAEFEKLLASSVNDSDPGADVMEAYRNYRHSAALRISECYEATGQPRKAYDYAVLARDKYPYRTWCGTCAQSSAKEMRDRIKRLAWSAGILPFVQTHPLLAVFSAAGAALVGVASLLAARRRGRIRTATPVANNAGQGS